MTREEAKELLPIIQAFVAGKQIQETIEGYVGWIDTDEIHFVYEGKKIKHRIKPEPKYRPFKDQEECWNEMHKHPDFGWVKNKSTKTYCNMTDIYKIKSRPVKITINNYAYTLNEIFNLCTFTDGTPFGIKEEQ